MTPVELDAIATRTGAATADSRTAQRLRDWSARVRHRWSRDLLGAAAGELDRLAAENARLREDAARLEKALGTAADALVRIETQAHRSDDVFGACDDIERTARRACAAAWDALDDARASLPTEG